MKKVLTIIYIVVLPCYLSAQKEGNIWYFGVNAGIDFNGGAPVPLTNSAMGSNIEGCATICSSNGDLLFYTNGVKIWNRNHLIMSNASDLLGHPSSTQSSIIVKKPGFSSIYLVFTVDYIFGSNGFRYSEVDMNLQNGLGDVNSNKNILISFNSHEKLTAVRHHNEVDYWIVHHLLGTNTYECYLLSENGLNSSPVVSNIGSTLGLFGSYGYLKASPNGKKIATPVLDDRDVELFDFDNSTGLLSNVMTFSGFKSGLLQGAYGIEFSSNSNILYVSTGSSNVHQFDLSSGLFPVIDGSRVIFNGGKGATGALQMGPDNRIYLAGSGKSYLGVIQDSNVPGLGCNYDSVGIFLSGNNSLIGLPNFHASVINPYIIEYSHICLHDSTRFSPNILGLDSLLWVFGDSISGINDSSKIIEPKHLYSDTGFFDVTLIIFSQGISDTIKKEVYIKALPFLELGEDTTLCEGETIELQPTYLGDSILWKDGSINPTLFVNQSDEYWVKTFDNECESLDFIDVNFIDLPGIKLNNDTILCYGEGLILDVSTLGGTYLWQDNSVGPTQFVKDPGFYEVEVKVGGCVNKKGVNIEFTYCNAFVEMPNVFTPNSDHINDFFTPKGHENLNQYTIKIYNRWGKNLFESSSIDEGWDGKCQDKECPEGIYYWVVNYRDVRKKEIKSMQGTLTLHR